MKYVQNTEEKSIFAKLYEDNPLKFCNNRTVDTEEARKKIKALRKKLDKIESLIDEVESWKSFKDELPKPKTHILIKREYEEEDVKDLQVYEKVDYLTGILKGGILYAGDRSGSMKVEITNEEIKNYYFWKYID